MPDGGGHAAPERTGSGSLAGAARDQGDRLTATVISARGRGGRGGRGLRDERFLILPHPEVADYLKGKATNPDAWVAGMRRLQAHHLRELEEIA